MSDTAVKNSAPRIIHNNREAAQKELQKFIEEEKRLVKGIFKNYECPGGSVTITQKKYKSEPMFIKDMLDGQEYEIPLWVARWLNGIDVTAKSLNGRINSCSYVKHQYSLDRITGQPVQVEGQKKQRYGFQSLDFM
jgi:hypothetical protein